MSDLPEILGSIVPGKEGSTAQTLFGAGLASLATGSPIPIAAALGKELLGWLFSSDSSDPSEFCSYDYNPLQIERVATSGDLAEFYGPGNPYRVVPRMVVRMRIGATPFNCIGDPPESLNHTFGSWWALVQAQDLRNRGQFPWANFWASWKILTEDEARDRYKLETTPFLQKVLTVGTKPSDIAKLESWYGGRVVDGSWLWGDEVLYGRKISEWPRWIPLDQKAAVLRRIYEQAYFGHGITDQDWNRMTLVAPVSAEKLSRMSVSLLRETLADSYVLAAARSQGDAEAFASAARKLRSLEESLGFVPEEQSGPQSAAMVRAGVTASGSPLMTRFVDIDDALQDIMIQSSQSSRNGLSTLWWSAAPAAIAVVAFSAVAWSILRRR